MFDQKASAETNRKIAANEATSSRRLINMAVVPNGRLQQRDRMVTAKGIASGVPILFWF